MHSKHWRVTSLSPLEGFLHLSITSFIADAKKNKTKLIRLFKENVCVYLVKNCCISHIQATWIRAMIWIHCCFKGRRHFRGPIVLCCGCSRWVQMDANTKFNSRRMPGSITSAFHARNTAASHGPNISGWLWLDCVMRKRLWQRKILLKNYTAKQQFVIMTDY